MYNWNYMRDGDDKYDRLRLYLQEKTGESIISIKRLSAKILFVEGVTKNWLLKPFNSAQNLSNQIVLTNCLRQNNFMQTYQFHPIHQNDAILWDQQLWGLFDYLEPKINDPFHYGTMENRIEALDLMRKFHNTSEEIIKELVYLRPYQLENKWRQRFLTFTSHASNIRLWIGIKSYQALLDYGSKSMQGLALHLKSDEEEVVLHGDLAHHNFFRHANGILYLVDFDLMGKGPRLADELQIANRILPSINWSFIKLMEQNHFSQYSSSLPFLYGLLFPSDLFREWNRFLYSSMAQQQQLWPFLYDLTVNQWTLRIRFYERVEKEIALLEGNN
ncbi:phosphotransferase [Mangrovibacillus cuniculi]|uniref:Phosphotransferase n=1 Tax=Mangrovibacillus cuniculi TaxID=2593652 RepID=A0A7S8HFL3_9BACI|nr:phosphotransferase [Mangrovibacillus cuniculi]QPC47029.1 phosphotransferase [Mangrovibacillus cuniculi]